MAQKNVDGVRALDFVFRCYTACQILDFCLVICKHLGLYILTGSFHPHKGNNYMNQAFLLKIPVPV